MSKEFDALIQNATWELVSSNPSQNIIGCNLNTMLMALLTITKLDLLLRVFINGQELITMKLLDFLSSLLLFELSFIKLIWWLVFTAT